MSDLVLAITQPAHGAVLTAPTALTGTANGNSSGMFFKWFSSLYAAGTESKPEINANHSTAALNFATPSLGEFGSHTLVLSATDREGIDLPSIKAVTRSALAGGAPPAAPNPCVVHQLSGVAILNPATNGLSFSKTSATIDVLAPGAWQKPDPDHAGQWIANTDYQTLNGITLVLRFEPDGPADAAHSAEVPLDLAALPVFRQSNKSYLRRTGALPANLLLGTYRLILKASAAGTTLAVQRQIVVTA